MPASSPEQSGRPVPVLRIMERQLRGTRGAHLYQVPAQRQRRRRRRPLRFFLSRQNVSMGQHSPIVRIVLSFCVFSVRGEVSIKRPTSTLHDPYFFSDILVVSYVLSCVSSSCCKRQQWRV